MPPRTHQKKTAAHAHAQPAAQQQQQRQQHTTHARSHVKPGDTQTINNVELVAKRIDNKIVWEPAAPYESDASRDAARQAQKDEQRWLKKQEADTAEKRLAEAKQVQRRERARKETVLGADTSSGGGRRRDPIVKPSELLLRTREEEAQARARSLDASAPGQYKFLAESLAALEKEYSMQEQEARRRAYERNRQRLLGDGGRGRSGGGGGGNGAGEGADDGGVEDLRSRLAKMSDEEFKALAQARKERAALEIAGDSTTPIQGEQRRGRGGRGGGGGGRDRNAQPPGKGRGGKARQRAAPPDPKDDPDYRR